ncbi:MAG: helicase-related protein [Candidatus Hodarchaeota archaeon]
MTGDSNIIIFPGQWVEARGARWKVITKRSNSGTTLLKLKGIDKAVEGEEIWIAHPLEEIKPIIQEPLKWNDPPVSDTEWLDLHRALCLRLSPSPTSITALERGAIILDEKYRFQLVPLLLAAEQPFPRLLLADDVGLGKTIEAGLILQELAARGRAEKILIVVPSGLKEQWKDEEMAAKFGFYLENLGDSATLKRIRANIPATANPWSFFQRIITSIDFIKRPEILREIRDIIWDVVVVDEAHYLLEAGTTTHLRGNLGRHLASKSRALLLLSATPHNGDPQAYRRLLGLLDPMLALEGKISYQKLQRHVVRRLKSKIGFITEPDIKSIPVNYSGQEKEFMQKLIEYTEWLKSKNKNEYTACAFAAMVFLRRCLSSPKAIFESLRRRQEKVGNIIATEGKQLAGDYLLGVPLNDIQKEKAEGYLIQSPSIQDGEGKYINDLIEILEKLSEGEDAKTKRLLKIIHEWVDQEKEKVIIFTEYRDTQQYLKDILIEHGYEERILLIHGGMSEDERKEVEKEFAKEGKDVLIATDAASEGINLQWYSRRVIHIELPWNPNRLEQRNGRVHRIGQEKKVEIINLIAPGTIEDRVLLKLYLKLQYIRRDLGPVPDVLGGLPQKIALGISWRQLDKEFDEKIENLKKDPAYREVDPKLKDFIIAPPPFLPNQYVREQFVKHWIKEFGGDFKEKIGEWQFKVPRSLLTSELEEEINGIFIPKDAVKKKKPFLGNQHPLVLSIADRLVARAERESFRKCAVKVLPKDVISAPGLINTYIIRLKVGEEKETFEERLIGVFVSVDGQTFIGKEVINLIETPSVTPRPNMELYNKVKNVWEKLKKQCDDYVKKWIFQYCEEAQNKWNEKLNHYRQEISSWFSERKKKLDEEFYARIDLFTYEEEKKRLEDELFEDQRNAEKLKQKYENLRGVFFEEPEPIGLLIVLPEERLS